MNYKMLRCIIQIILIIIFIVVNKVIFKKNLCINKKIILFEFIFMAFVYLYPIYLNYLKFDSLERAFSFYKPHQNIVQQYTIENFTYVIYETNTSPADFVNYYQSLLNSQTSPFPLQDLQKAIQMN